MLMTRVRRAVAGWAWLVVLGVGPAFGISTGLVVAHEAPPPALGLIVKLKDPASTPAQPTGGREKAASVRPEPLERLQRVLAEARLKPMRLRPSGRSGQHLDFGRLLPGAEAEQLAAQLRARPDVEWVVPNVREKRLQVVQPQDPHFPAGAFTTGQWWLHPVAGSSQNAVRDRLRGVPGIQTAWSTHRGANTAVVAVLDTGITPHPDLVGRLLPGYDFVSEVAHAGDGHGRDDDPADPGDGLNAEEAALPIFGNCGTSQSSWHGTVIAGLLAALTDNNAGVAGINWNGRVLPVRVAGKCGAVVSDIIDGMRWAAGLRVTGVPDNPNPARIVNISFGGNAACNQAYQDAINELAGHGVVVVAAAGNEHGAVSRPASCTGVIGVAALNRDGFKATYSSFGPQLVIATVGGDPQNGGAWGAFGPGNTLSLADEGLLTLSNDGLQGPGQPSYARVSGTSFATPVTAGVLSLMLSVRPNLTLNEMRAGLQASARPHVVSTQIGACSNANPGRCLCTHTTCGAGILDAPEALRYAQSPASYQPLNLSPASVDSEELGIAASSGLDLPANLEPAPSGGGRSGGGGALGFGWLLALGAVVVALRQRGTRAG